jgi:integrase
MPTGCCRKLSAIQYATVLRPRMFAAAEGAPKVDAEEIVILTPDQIEGRKTKLSGRRIYPHVIVALYTGLRRGELLALAGLVSTSRVTLCVFERRWKKRKPVPDSKRRKRSPGGATLRCRRSWSRHCANIANSSLRRGWR